MHHLELQVDQLNKTINSVYEFKTADSFFTGKLLSKNSREVEESLQNSLKDYEDKLDVFDEPETDELIYTKYLAWKLLE